MIYFGNKVGRFGSGGVLTCYPISNMKPVLIIVSTSREAIYIIFCLFLSNFFYVVQYGQYTVL